MPTGLPFKRRVYRGSMVAIIGAMALSACSVTEPPVLRSTGQMAGNGAGITLADAGGRGGRHAVLRAALEREFALYGIRMEPGRTVQGDYALAIAPARNGLAEAGGDGAPAAADGPDWRAEPRRRRFLENCEAQRVRATLLLLNATDGGVTYRGEAEQVVCDVTDATIDDLAVALARDAMTAE